jgi:LacI family transcriptional regulator
MKPTVYDIAHAAGVSLATVDRVLNARPGVRSVTREKVEQAISELGYVRDLAAANLAKGRTYSFCFILPANDNSFMVRLREEVQEAILHSAVERTQIEIIDVSAFDPDALVSAIDEVLVRKPDGVAMVAVDAPDVRVAVDRLKKAGIPVVTLVSDLSASSRDHFSGIDNSAAGRTAANLMGRFLRKVDGRVAILAGSMLVRDHRERLEGFLAVLAEDFPRVAILPVIEAQDDPATVEAMVRETLRRFPDLSGIYSLGAGNRGLIRVLKGLDPARRPRPGRRCRVISSTRC